MILNKTGGEKFLAVRLFIGNLPYSATSQELNTLFAQAGTVTSADVVMDRMSGRSRGFGFVEMSTEEEGQAAISQFNGYEMDGRKLVVNVARPREDRPQTGGGTVYEQKEESNQ